MAPKNHRRQRHSHVSGSIVHDEGFGITVAKGIQANPEDMGFIQCGGKWRYGEDDPNQRPAQSASTIWQPIQELSLETPQ